MSENGLRKLFRIYKIKIIMSVTELLGSTIKQHIFFPFI
jgi:hypothetical protein